MNEEEQIEAEHPNFYQLLIPLLRAKKTDLDAYLHKVAIDVPIDGTSAKAHCYFITLDGSKRPRVNDFAKFLGCRITDFAIPRSEILKALKKCQETNSTSAIAEINATARNLFTRLPLSGEGGELLLSLFAEALLGLPQLFTKMYLKTSSAMHVHGTDGIHIGLNKETGHLALYWGESKLYGDVAQATLECFSSLAPYLLDDGGSGTAKENDLRLIRYGIDLQDPALETAIKRYLDPNDTMFQKMEHRGICLIGFDSEHYPTAPNTKEITDLQKEIQQAFDSRKSHIGKRISEEKIHSFVLEIFCVPFPSVESFRQAFRKELGLTDGEANL